MIYAVVHETFENTNALFTDLEKAEAYAREQIEDTGSDRFRIVKIPEGEPFDADLGDLYDRGEPVDDETIKLIHRVQNMMDISGCVYVMGDSPKVYEQKVVDDEFVPIRDGVYVFELATGMTQREVSYADMMWDLVNLDPGCLTDEYDEARKAFPEKSISKWQFMTS